MSAGSGPDALRLSYGTSKVPNSHIKPPTGRDIVKFMGDGGATVETGQERLRDWTFGLRLKSNRQKGWVPAFIERGLHEAPERSTVPISAQIATGAQGKEKGAGVMNLRRLGPAGGLSFQA